MDLASADIIIAVTRWRVGEHYGIHVYEGDRPVATFHRAEDAAEAVGAVAERDRWATEYRRLWDFTVGAAERGPQGPGTPDTVESLRVIVDEARTVVPESIDEVRSSRKVALDAVRETRRMLLEYANDEGTDVPMDALVRLDSALARADGSTVGGVTPVPRKGC